MMDAKLERQRQRKASEGRVTHNLGVHAEEEAATLR